MKRQQYAPFGIGNCANQFWVHTGSYTAPFHTLEAAKQFARGYRCDTYIMTRDGRKVWKRTAAGKEFEY